MDLCQRIMFASRSTPRLIEIDTTRIILESSSTSKGRSVRRSPITPATKSRRRRAQILDNYLTTFSSSIPLEITSEKATHAPITPHRRRKIPVCADTPHITSNQPISQPTILRMRSLPTAVCTPSTHRPFLRTTAPTVNSTPPHIPNHPPPRTRRFTVRLFEKGKSQTEEVK